ncbi:uncharacterized protein DSM5745_09630 [Aspergillus mulundensis]|uniref:Uncharacterized protein n=1 Tax=Aspergillus mulundensis TaxID=1810919 RepID=A0A3D8QW24_9EURO|nr:Uncharacterized protein DSM5745_09630 [Aspergillus mulundensis]RDW65891.1 Uncharacterized protein DSM5745_09630 [Aspergillus mulundensis]
MPYLQSIDVRYGEDPSSEPSAGIKTVDGSSADINAGFGGDFVWLIPTYGSAATAASSIRIIIQGDADSAYYDLAKGAGGDYRYLRLERDGGAKISEVKLLRRGDGVDFAAVQALGFQGVSGDINEGRGGDFLYLVWKY